MNKITEAYKPGNGEDTFKINIPITRPGKDININKVSFDPKSYLEVMKSDFVKEAFDNRIGLPLTLDSDFYKDMYIPKESWIGKVIKWTPEYIIAEISRDNYNKYIAPYNDVTEMKAGILGYGDFVEGSEEVFALKKVIGFQLLYGISAKTLEKVEVPAEKKEEPEDEGETLKPEE